MAEKIEPTDSIETVYQKIRDARAEWVILTEPPDELMLLLGPYGWQPGETLGDVRARMSPEDAAELDELAAVVWPDGTVH